MYIFLKLWASLISNMYSDFSYLASTQSYSPSKWVHFACFCLFLTIFSLLWRAITFDRRKIWKIWIHIWNQRGSKFQKNIIWNILSKKKKSSFSSSSFFIFIFKLFERFFSLNSSSQNYLFNEVLLLIIYFYLQEQLTKMCRLPELLE